MSLNFDDYDSILSSLNNGAANNNQKQQGYGNDENKDINFNNSLFSNFDPVTSVNLNQLEMGAANNYQNEKLSNSTYDSFSPSYTNTESSPEAILFGDNYKQEMLKAEQAYDFAQAPFTNNMEVDEILSNDYNFESATSNSTNQFDLPALANSSTSSPDSFNSSPDSIVAFQPQQTDDVKPVKGKRGRKPLVKTESSTSPPTLTKTLSSSSGITKPGKKIKSSHNLIEKKYRTNINSKIIELRNCVPALRILISKNHNLHNGGQPSSNNENETGEFEDDYEGDGYTDDESKLDGLKPAKKLNKATILSKATEYIRHLEYKVEVLSQENEKLREIVINSNGADFSNTQLKQEQSPQSMTSSPPQRQQQQSQSRSNLTNNLIMGGLTCLVGASTLDDFDSSNGNFRRSLFSVPVFSFGSNQSSSFAFKPLFGLLKIIFVFGVLFYMLEPFFASSKDDKKKNGNTFEWSSIVKNLQYLSSPKLFVSEVLTIKKAEAYQPLLVSSADLQLSTLVTNFARLSLKFNSTEVALLKSIYLRFIADFFPLFKFLIVKQSEKYWTKAQDALKPEYKNANTRDLLQSYKFVLKEDAIFNDYVNVLTSKKESFIKFSSPFEILSKLIIESQFNKTLKTLVELEILQKQEEIDEEHVKQLDTTVHETLNGCISLSNTLGLPGVELMFLKSLINPSVANITDALSLVKSGNNEINHNSLVCGLLKLQVLTNDLDKSKLLILFKKLDLTDIDLLSFTSLYSMINIFPKDLLQEEDDEDIEDSASDSSIEYKENHSIEFKLNEYILSTLASLRIFVGKKDNNVGLTNEIKSILIDDFVQEINELDC